MKLSKHCYALTGFAYIPPWGVNAGIIVGEEKTLVVDTGPTMQAAATIHGYAQAVQRTNQLIAINTEEHLDHISGNAYFAGLGIDIHGHKLISRNDSELAAEIKSYTTYISNPVRRERDEGRILFENTRIANPNKRFERDLLLDLGVITAQVFLTPGHTPTNVSISVPTDGVVYCGDCIVSGYLPNLEGGDAAAWKTWLESLDRIAALAPKILVCGHGPVLEGHAVNEEIARIRGIVQDAIATGHAPTQRG
jgi:glyoxylase-like metal-dependent hydrolase (beta-lactamase superfamily II)